MASNDTQTSNLKTVMIQDWPNGKIYRVTLPLVLAQQVEHGDADLCRKILDNIQQAAIPSSATEPIAMESDTVPYAELLSDNGDSDPSDVEDSTLGQSDKGNSSKEGESLWTREATLLLISLYQKHESEMESLACRKKTVWARITKDLNRNYNFTQNQVESKWRGLVRSYKKVVDNKRQTGAKRVSFQYFKEMEEVLSRRHDIQPPVLVSSDPSTQDPTNQQRKKFCVRPNMSRPTGTENDRNANVDTDELSDSDTSDLNSSVLSEKDSNLKKSESKSAKRRRESRKGQNDSEDIALQTLTLLKQMEENRREDQRRAATQLDERNQLLKELIETLNK